MEYSYVAYIDEAGDDGLRVVKPNHPNGSSEWLIISAVVVRAKNEKSVPVWVRDIRDGLWRHNRPDIHFAKLTPNKKKFVCEETAKLDARFFVVASNKRNMQGYRNPMAEKIPSKNWFYCWMTRVLLERVTDFVFWHAKKTANPNCKLRIEYSERGGLSYSQMKAYYSWLKWKSDASANFLSLGDLKWPVMDAGLLKVYNHKQRAGLQLADIVASSFFKAMDVYDTKECDPQFAKALKPRMAHYRDTKDGLISGYGLKLLPGFKRLELLPEQSEIFRYYGYPKEWWDPDPSNPRAYRSFSNRNNRPHERHRN